MNIYTVEIRDDSCCDISIANTKYQQTNRQVWSLDCIYIYKELEFLSRLPRVTIRPQRTMFCLNGVPNSFLGH